MKAIVTGGAGSAWVGACGWVGRGVGEDCEVF